ncbi:MAG: hypothetical protein ACI9KE_003555 [Polyangiales bacterium]|jgi:hypothetical protein
MRALPALLLCFVVLFGCGDDEANEARLLIDRIEGLGDPDLDARRQRVNALMRLPITSPRVQAVHEACVPMHEALLRADEASVEARTAVDELEAGDQRAGERAADALARSESAVLEVRDRRASCEELLAQLRTRYAPRRESGN